MSSMSRSDLRASRCGCWIFMISFCVTRASPNSYSANIRSKRRMLVRLTRLASREGSGWLQNEIMHGRLPVPPRRVKRGIRVPGSTRYKTLFCNAGMEGNCPDKRKIACRAVFNAVSADRLTSTSRTGIPCAAIPCRARSSSARRAGSRCNSCRCTKTNRRA